MPEAQKRKLEQMPTLEIQVQLVLLRFVVVVVVVMMITMIMMIVMIAIVAIVVVVVLVKVFSSNH